MFAVRTYLTPLTEIKAEGSGLSLADACESMPEKFGRYKNRPTWGESLCSWLRQGNPSIEAGTGISHLKEKPTCPFSQQPASEETICPFAP